MVPINRLMFTILLSSVIISTAISHRVPFKPRIVNGNKAAVGQFPYMVSIYDYSRVIHICGGAILTDRHVLSAAHCLIDFKSMPDRLWIVPGLVRLTKVTNSAKNITEIIFHPSFKVLSYHHDLSLLRIADKLHFNEFIKPIALPISKFVENDNVMPVVSGFGATAAPEYDHETAMYSKRLMYHRTKLMSLNECKRRFKPFGFLFMPDENFICTSNSNGKSICIQDAGDPLIWNDILIGIATWSTECSSSYPDAYTKTFSHIDWIKEEMKQ